MRRRCIKRSVWTVAVVALAVALTGSASLGMRRRVEPEEILPIKRPALKEAGLAVNWHGKFELEKNENLIDMYNGGGVIIGVTDKKRVVVMDAARGVNLWAKRVAKNFENIFRPAFYREMVYVATTTRLIGFRIRDGREEMNVRLGFAPSGPPVTNGSFCYIPASNGWFKAIVLPRKDLAYKRWKWDRWTPASLTSAACFTQNRVFFADSEGTVYYSRLDDRDVVECFKADGPITADLRVYANYLILAPSKDYELYALNQANGKPVWIYYANEAITKPAYVSGESIFVFAKGQGVATLDAKSGKRKWQRKDAVDFVAAGPSVLMVASADNDLMGLAPETGKVAFEVPLRAGALWTANEIDDVAYLSMATGEVMAVRLVPAKK